jgi:hypothetical protein
MCAWSVIGVLSAIGLSGCGSSPANRDHDVAEAPRDVVKRGGVELRKAAAAGDLSRIEWLFLQYPGAVNSPDAVGYTALHWAVRNNRTEMALLLLERGADPNVVAADGSTPLALAKQSNAVEITGPSGRRARSMRAAHRRTERPGSLNQSWSRTLCSRMRVKRMG